MAKVLISIPDSFIEKVDKFAEGECYTRSELIRQALREYMQNKKKDVSEVVV